MLTKNQWHYIKFWSIAVIATEVLMFLFNTRLVLIYTIIAFLFLGGFILRLTHLYPGKDEPLILDASGIVIALLMTTLAQIEGPSSWRFLLILTSSVIIMPHLAFIVANNDIV